MSQPSDKQKQAGNYPKEHRIVAGMRVSVENKAGTERSGTDKDGTAWKQTLSHDYGYIRGTKGRDKDHIDTFLGPLVDKKDVPVYVIDQGNEDGTFDEHKVMLGFGSEQDASDAYHANYEPGWRGFQDIKPLSMTDFKNWAFTDGARKKPIALCKGGRVEPQKLQAGGLVKLVKPLKEFLKREFEWNPVLEGMRSSKETADALPHAAKYFAARHGVSPEEAELMFSGAHTSSFIDGYESQGAFPMFAMPAKHADMVTGYSGTDPTKGVIKPYLGNVRKRLDAPNGVSGQDLLNLNLDPSKYYKADKQGLIELYTPELQRALKSEAIYDAGYAEGGVVENEGGAAFLSPNAGKRRNNDRTASAGMPLQAARGWAAGTLGLPGDIEGIGRAILKAGAADGSYIDRNMNSEPALPTSDFYKEWLPGYDASPNGKAAAELGSLFGGVGAGRAARKGAEAAQGAGRAVKGALTTLGDSMAAARPAYVPIGQEGAIKLKGGNWAPGSLDEFVQNFIVDPMPGPGQTGVVKDPVNDWFGKQFKRYVQNDLGTTSDPLLRLEKDGRLHMSQERLLERSTDSGVSRNPFEKPGEPTVFPVDMRTARDNTNSGEAFHLSQTKRDYRTPWENLSDGNIYSGNADEALKPFLNAGYLDPSYEWIKKLDPKSTVHALSQTDTLGFDHVRDYMDAAINANTHHINAPSWQAIMDEDPIAANMIQRGLHIDPTKLQNMSVADMVGKTAEWDKLLAKQKANVDMNVGIKQVHKQYDNGQQWVELAPEGLKAEGDAMRHCVGGYCSSVEDGSKRILSLRGKDGKPMVTVELAKPQAKTMDKWNVRNALTTEEFGKYINFAETANSIPDQLRQAGLFESVAERLSGKGPLQIAQIKGPANRKPSAEALEQVQDLVRGKVPGFEKWGDVGDLQNSGLINVKDSDIGMPAGYYSRDEIADYLKSTGVPESQVNKHLQKFIYAEGGRVSGYAQGGPVLRPLKPLYSPTAAGTYRSTAATAPSVGAYQPDGQGNQTSYGGVDGTMQGALSSLGSVAGMSLGMTGNPGLGQAVSIGTSANPGQAALSAGVSMASHAMGLGPLGSVAMGVVNGNPAPAIGSAIGFGIGGPPGAMLGSIAGSLIGKAISAHQDRKETEALFSAMADDRAQAEANDAMGKADVAAATAAMGSGYGGNGGDGTGGMGGVGSASGGASDGAAGSGGNANGGGGGGGIGGGQLKRGGRVTRRRTKSWT